MIRAWPLWKLRWPALAYVLLVQAIALALAVFVVATTPSPGPRQMLMFTMLAATAGTVIVGTSVSIRLRKVVRRDPWTIHISYLACGALTLPPNLLVLLLLGPALHGVLDVRPELHRWMFTTAATTLATFAARGVIGWDQPRWDPVLFVLTGIPSENGLADSVAQAAGPLSLFFPGLVAAPSETLQVILDFGLAAGFWMLVAGLLGRVFG